MTAIVPMKKCENGSVPGQQVVDALTNDKTVYNGTARALKDA